MSKQTNGFSRPLLSAFHVPRTGLGSRTTQSAIPFIDSTLMGFALWWGRKTDTSWCAHTHRKPNEFCEGITVCGDKKDPTWNPQQRQQWKSRQTSYPLWYFPQWLLKLLTPAHVYVSLCVPSMVSIPGKTSKHMCLQREFYFQETL